MSASQSMNQVTEKLLKVGKDQNWYFAQHDFNRTQDFDLRQRIVDALQNPVDFPPLRQAIIDSDHVAIAVCSIGNCVNGVIAELTETINQILVDGEVFAVVPEKSFSHVFEASIEAGSDFSLDTVKLKKHHQANPDGFAYLGPDAGGEPISANRDLVECDFVIPVVVVQSGIESIELQFARQFGGDGHDLSPGKDEIELNEQINYSKELIRSMGIFYGVMITVSPGGEVVSIEAGSWQSLLASSRQFIENKWKIEPGDADVLVATIENQGQHQVVDTINRAICVADQICPNGEIVILDLVSLDVATDEPPADDLDDISRDDAFELEDQAKDIIARRRMHCFSETEGNNVWEQLGFGCTNELDDLLRWLGKFKHVSCVRNIHHVQSG